MLLRSFLDEASLQSFSVILATCPTILDLNLRNFQEAKTLLALREISANFAVIVLDDAQAATARNCANLFIAMRAARNCDLRKRRRAGGSIT